jgi:hypothetical protein
MDELHSFRIYRQEILALLLHLRKCIELPHIPEQYTILKEAIPALGLKLGMYTREPIDIECVVISNNDTYLDRLLDFLENSAIEPNTTEWHTQHGLLLGYPECCCRAYSGNVHFVPHPMKSMNWMLNHILNMESKVREDERDLIERMDKNNYKWGFYLLPHIPCTYNCQQSLDFVSRIFRQLEESFTDFAYALQHLMQKPILLLDTYNFVVFDGRVKDNTIRYRSIIDMNNLADRDLLSDFRECNRIVKSGKKLALYKDSQLHNQIELDATLYNFC